MLLSQLLQDIYPISPSIDRDISQLTIDSRNVRAKHLFLALKGIHLDGRHYIADAISQGATAVLMDADTKAAPVTLQKQVPLIPIHQLSEKIGIVAARFYDEPAKKLRMLGVTGTSGKTSCTHFIAQSLTALHKSCGIIGTLGSGFYGALSDMGLTTPDAVTLQATLHQLHAQGAQAVAMEVSSHSIDQGRINAIPFTLGIFTNLSHDHLDYHGDMETYAAVKRRFFEGWPMSHAIINADDDYGRQWIRALSLHHSVFAYSIQKRGNISSIYCEQLEFTFNGIRGYVHTPWGNGWLTLPLIGEFNLSNSLAVLCALCVYGLPLSDVLQCLSQLKPVPGRMQMLGGCGKPLVIVDYAHKPDALMQVLKVLRAHTRGNVICVFGCGGERDRSKRPLMAKIAEIWADRVIVTNDNPRHEQPDAIAAEIVRGFSKPEKIVVELDRSKAIKNSIQWARAQDCVLIAGKGAECYQQIGDEKIPFDDVKNVQQYLNEVDQA